MANFFWDDTEVKRIYHLAKWDMVAQKKDSGVLGITNIREMNIAPSLLLDQEV